MLRKAKRLDQTVPVQGLVDLCARQQVYFGIVPSARRNGIRIGLNDQLFNIWSGVVPVDLIYKHAVCTPCEV